MTQAAAVKLPVLPDELGNIGPWYAKKAAPQLLAVKRKRIDEGTWDLDALYSPRPRPCFQVVDDRWAGQFGVMSESERVVYDVMKHRDIMHDFGKRLEKGDTVTLSLRDLRRLTGYSTSRLSRVIDKLIYHKVVMPWNPVANTEGVRRMRGEQKGNRLKTTYYLPFYDSIQAAWRDDPGIAKDPKFGRGCPWTRGRGKRFLTPEEFKDWEIEALPPFFGRPMQAAAIAPPTTKSDPLPAEPTVWDAIKERLKSGMSKEAWRNWIRRTHQKAIDGPTVYVYVPDEATRVCLTQDYPRLIAEAADASGCIVQFEVDPIANRDALVVTAAPAAAEPAAEFSEELMCSLEGYIGSSDSYVESMVRDFRTLAKKQGYTLTDDNMKSLVSRAQKRQQPDGNYNAAWFRTVISKMLPGLVSQWRDQAAKRLKDSIRVALAELEDCATAAEREAMLAKLRRDEPEVYAAVRPPP